MGRGYAKFDSEAMAWGLPVITRAVGGVRDFFENGKMGFATDSKDPVAFFGYMDELARDAAKTQLIGEYNREYAKNILQRPKSSHALRTSMIQYCRDTDQTTRGRSSSTGWIRI